MKKLKSVMTLLTMAIFTLIMKTNAHADAETPPLKVGGSGTIFIIVIIIVVCIVALIVLNKMRNKK